MFRNTISFIVAGLVLVPAMLVHADDSSAAKGVDKDSMTDLDVELSDAEGNPVVGAAVTAYAMRMQEGGGHGYWNYEKHGPPTPVVSDKDGIAVVRYPAKVSGATQVMTTRLVSFSVSHYDFVEQTVHFDLGPEKAEVTLKRGCEIQLSAVDSAGQTVRDFGVLMAGPYAPSHWVDHPESGGRRTGAASDGNWQTLLVKPQSDGVTLFSSVMPLRVRPSQAVRIRNLRMKPGARIQGRLSDDVPRPVKNGFVVTTTAPRPANDSWSKDDPSVTWNQCEDVNEDGTFVLKSIPRSGKVQIIAICDGWVSSTVPKHRAFVKGQLFDIEDDVVDVTVAMEETGSLDVTVHDQDGNPFNGGTFSSWPNQQYYKGGSTVLGRRYNTITLIENQILPIDDRKVINWRSKLDMPFSNQPVKAGKATLLGLPIGFSNSLALLHPDYILDVKEGEGDVFRSSARFVLDSTKPKKLELKVKKKDGTN